MLPLVGHEKCQGRSTHPLDLHHLRESILHETKPLIVLAGVLGLDEQVYTGGYRGKLYGQLLVVLRGEEPSLVKLLEALLLTWGGDDHEAGHSEGEDPQGGEPCGDVLGVHFHCHATSRQVR